MSRLSVVRMYEISPVYLNGCGKKIQVAFEWNFHLLLRHPQHTHRPLENLPPGELFHAAFRHQRHLRQHRIAAFQGNAAQHLPLFHRRTDPLGELKLPGYSGSPCAGTGCTVSLVPSSTVTGCACSSPMGSTSV